MWLWVHILSCFGLVRVDITPRIIAMGYPSEHVEGLYRNPMNEVVRFLELRHQDRYKIYNLCSERIYDSTKFHGPVAHFPFDDHNAPPYEILRPFCVSVKAWLDEHTENIVVVHCKAGKGRTGVMICVYLLFEGMFKTAEEVLKFYGEARTLNGEGVTIPSQIRYIHYWCHSITRSRVYKEATVYLHCMELHPPPKHVSSSHLFFTIYSNNVRLLNSKKSNVFPVEDPESSWKFAVANPLPLQGDIKIQFYVRDRFTKETLFQFWLNTSAHSELTGTKNAWCFHKHELDKANKDRHHKRFESTFQVTLYVSDTKPFIKSNSEHTALLLQMKNDLPPTPLPIAKSKGLSLSVPLTMESGAETEDEPDLFVNDDEDEE